MAEQSDLLPALPPAGWTVIFELSLLFCTVERITSASKSVFKFTCWSKN